MANYGKYDLPIFEDDIITIKEYFKIAVNNIFFHRWLGSNKYEDKESIFNNLTYVYIKNQKLQDDIEKNISILEKNLLKNKKVQVIINFYQKVVTKYIIMQEPVGKWESWIFTFVLKQSSGVISSSKENKIRDNLIYILQKLNEKFDFMPDFNINSNLPEETFPYDITINFIDDNEFLLLLKEIGKNAVNDND